MSIGGYREGSEEALQRREDRFDFIVTVPLAFAALFAVDYFVDALMPVTGLSRLAAFGIVGVIAAFFTSRLLRLLKHMKAKRSDGR